MKRYIYLIYLYLVLLCSYNNESATYRHALREYPLLLVNHFPDTLSRYYMIDKTDDVTNKCIYFSLFEFNKKDTYFPDNAIAKYQSIDTNLVTIKTDAAISWGITKKVFYNSIQYHEIIYYPVPYFEGVDIDHIESVISKDDLYSSNTVSGLAEGFSIYVLDAKSGHYWKGLKPLDYMPEGWKNGYSRGICINEKKRIVIYWTIIW